MKSRNHLPRCSGFCKGAILALAWKIDHLMHRIIQWLDPITDEDVKEMLDALKRVDNH